MSSRTLEPHSIGAVTFGAASTLGAGRQPPGQTASIVAASSGRRHVITIKPEPESEGTIGTATSSNMGRRGPRHVHTGQLYVAPTGPRSQAPGQGHPVNMPSGGLHVGMLSGGLNVGRPAQLASANGLGGSTRAQGFPPARRATVQLTKRKKAALGCLRPGHRSCVRCWEVAQPSHLANWAQCHNTCPACPDDAQHWGQACPQLLKDTNNEWWVSHCGIEKPALDQLVQNLSLQPMQTLNTEPASGANSMTMPFARLSHGSVPSNAAPFPASRLDSPRGSRTGRDTRGDRRSRSPSPDNENGARYRTRNSYRDRPASRFPSPTRDREPYRTNTYHHERPFEPGVERSQQPAAPIAASQGLDTGSAPPRGANDNDGNSTGASSTNAAHPTAIVWSNGTVTSPSVRELLMHDGWMAMIVHQNVLFADFFQRHPEATRGEHIISEGMGHYLSEIRSHHPDYLSATSTLRSQGEAQGGAQRNVQGDTQNDDQGNGGQNDGGAVFGFAN